MFIRPQPYNQNDNKTGVDPKHIKKVKTIKNIKCYKMIVLIWFSYAGRGAEGPTDHFAPSFDSGR